MNEAFRQALLAKYHHPMQDALWRMPQGAARRRRILELLAQGGQSVCVNRRYCPNLRFDRDLVQLLREGKLLRTRSGVSRTSRHTLLVLASAPGQGARRG